MTRSLTNALELKVNFRDVFTPNDQPDVTYVARGSTKLEAKLRDYLETRNIVVSISGPSKTGKTVLLKKVVEADSLITLSGAAINSANDFWIGILSWMEAPTERVLTSSKSHMTSAGVKGGGKVGIPLLAEGEAEGNASYAQERISSEAGTLVEDPFSRVIKDIGNSDFIIFIDDFHYIPRDAQSAIARIIKALAENGVKICTASVPHRTEDVVRANGELHGRLAAIDIPEWSSEELVQIAQKGFKELKTDIDDEVFKRLASEAFGSPQLMQAMCMNLCRTISVRETNTTIKHYPIDEEKFLETLRDTSDFANFSSVVQLLHSGPKVHGTERKQFSLISGQAGDVYRAILLGIAANPPARSFTYDDVLTRVKSVCQGEAPTGSSVSGSLGLMATIATENFKEAPILEWDMDILTIIDPYFAFYLRSSTKLETLG